MGENYKLYQSFVTVDLREEGQEFMQSGQFTGEVGDLMVFTLSNILQSPIAIFTSIPNLPVICITPMFVHAESDNPIFLTFIQEGPGHYDYAIVCESESDDPRSICIQEAPLTIKQTKCHCGRKKDYQGQSCTIVNGCSRCPCIRSENSCNSECKCKNCNNPCGIRQVVSTRSRKSYLVQKQQPLCGRPGQDFMTHFGEKISYGTLSQLEILVLKCATVFFILYTRNWSTSETLIRYIRVDLQCRCALLYRHLFSIIHKETTRYGGILEKNSCKDRTI